MKYLVRFFVCLFLITVQTVVLTSYPVFYGFYDLLLIFVVFSSFSESLGAGLFFVIFSGLVMDSLSGGSFGVFFTTYIWLFCSIRWLVQYLHAQNILLISLLLFAGIVFENTLSAFIYMLNDNQGGSVALILNLLIKQLMWMILTGGAIYYILAVFIKYAEKQVEALIVKIRKNQV